MAQDIERFKKTPATGSEAGSQSVIDYNLAIEGTFRIPSGLSLTLNGAKPEKDYYIRGFDGGIYFYFEGQWRPVSLKSANLSGLGERTVVAGPDGSLKIGNPDMSVGVTVNSSSQSLSLNLRGYYNYVGSGSTSWSLPSVIGIPGRFYRIYNKASDQVSVITIDPNGSEKFFRGGMRLESLDLQYGENLTLVSDGIDWNIYG